MMIEEIVSRFDGAKKTARGEYVARCSAHEDKSPSLAIAEGRDGRILIKCFAGCGIVEVLDAVGLTISDVMPDRVSDYHEVLPRMPISPRTALNLLGHTAMTLAVMACRVAYQNKPISLEDKDKFCELAGEINKIRSMSE